MALRFECILLRRCRATPGAWVLLTVLLVQGCATVTVPTADGGEKTMTVEAFEQYTEAVFRRQNQASNQVIMLADEVDDATYTTLQEAEKQMLEACAPLNDYAVHERDQESASLSLKRSIPRTIDACDRATRHLETLLSELDA